MKITMDLFPKQYKCIPRAWKGIFLLCAMILVDAALWFGLKYYYDGVLRGIEEMGEEQITIHEGEKTRKEQEVSKKKAQLEKVSLPPTEILNLNKQIEFFNKIYENSFSWYEFMDKIELLTPKNVWIKEIKINFGEEIADQEFELKCESTEAYDAPTFLKNIVNYPEFCGPIKPGGARPAPAAAPPPGPGAAPAPGAAAPAPAPAPAPAQQGPRERGQPLLSTVIKNDDGGHEFSMKFRFLPVKSFTVFKAGDKDRKPLPALKMRTGETVRLGVLGVNISKDAFPFSASHYKVDILEPSVGIWAPYDETFTARAPGVTDLLFTSLDKKHQLRLPVEVAVQ